MRLVVELGRKCRLKSVIRTVTFLVENPGHENFIKFYLEKASCRKTGPEMIKNAQHNNSDAKLCFFDEK